MMPEDFQPPQCFECNNDLDFNEENKTFYCEECDSIISKVDYEKQQEEDWKSRLDWDKKNHPEWFKGE